MRPRIHIAGAVAAALLLVACGGEADPDPADVEVDEPVDAGAEEESGSEADGAGTDSDPEAAEADGGSEQGASDEEMEPSSTPEADAARLEDPCAEHEGREDDLFIDLVSPVDEQVASDEVDLVGCSNVFEANVVWHLLDGDGVLLDEGFTTAECGTGCVGAFRDVVPLDAAEGEPVAYLQVFSPNMSDEGPDQLALTEVIVVLD